MTPAILWLYVAGVTFLILGLVVVRRELIGAVAMDKLIGLGPVFYGASIAVFGAEHLTNPRGLMQLVPPWMPERLFWAYFVGFALLAGAASLVLKRYVRLSAALLGAMFFLFVLMVHLPNVVAAPRGRLFWTIALRDLTFAAGAWALAGMPAGVRFLIAIPVIFFGVETMLHPELVPGIPLAKSTPVWIPLRVATGYATGLILLITGAMMLVKSRARSGAVWLGAWIALIVVFINVPVLARAVTTGEMLEGLNYVFDTLLFSGAILLLASRIPRGRSV